MCVTNGPADIQNTRTFVYATDLGAGPVHVCGYQNMADSKGPNCMFLNFAGRDLRVVGGPETTMSFMDDMTAELPTLEPVFVSRSAAKSGGVVRVTVVDYGDYSLVIAQGPADILTVLGEVPEDRRPVRTPRLEAMINFYMSWSPTHSFVLGCFNGTVNPRHPIVVQYEPNDPTVLTLPGLDGHNGEVPVPGANVNRDFRCAFGVNGVTLPHGVKYFDPINDARWAPESVAGFVDNRHTAPNGDYVVPLDAVQRGLTGRQLAALLITT